MALRTGSPGSALPQPLAAFKGPGKGRSNKKVGEKGRGKGRGKGQKDEERVVSNPKQNPGCAASCMLV